MRCHELETRPQATIRVLRQSKEDDEKEKSEATGLISRQYDPLAQLSARTGSKPDSDAQIAGLRHSITGRPSGAAGSILRLQRTYGNRYTQELIARSTQSNETTEVAPEVEGAIQAARGSGQALDSGVRSQMESFFDTDFSGVRMHTGAEADILNRTVGARAFATGQDVFFREGEYQPGSSRGREVLAHELTHVVQQNGQIRRKLHISHPEDRYEQEADQVARQALEVEQTGAANDKESMQRPTESQEEDEKPDQGLLEQEENVSRATSQYSWIQRSDGKTKSAQKQVVTKRQRRRAQEEKPANLQPKEPPTFPTLYLWTPDEARYQGDYNRAFNYAQAYIENALSTTHAMIIAYLAAEKEVKRIMALKDPESIWKTITMLALSIAVRAIPGAAVIADRLGSLAREKGHGYFAKGLEEGIKVVGSYLAERKIAWSPAPPQIESTGDALGLLKTANRIVQQEIKVKRDMFDNWQLAWEKCKADPFLPPPDYSLYTKVASKFEPNVSLSAEDIQPKFEIMMAEQAIRETVEASSGTLLFGGERAYDFYKPTLSRASLKELVNKYGFTLSHIVGLTHKGWNAPYAPWNVYQYKEGEEL